MSTTVRRAAAVAAITLGLGAVVAPAATAAAPTADPPAAAEVGSVVLCFPLGSVEICF